MERIIYEVYNECQSIGTTWNFRELVVIDVLSQENRMNAKAKSIQINKVFQS